jgi:hypothetical protein
MQVEPKGRHLDFLPTSSKFSEHDKHLRAEELDQWQEAARSDLQSRMLRNLSPKP